MPMLWPRLAWQPAEPVCRPAGDHVGEPVDEVLVDLEAKWRLGKLLGVAHENAALAEQPQRADGHLQHGAIKAFLAAEVIIDRGLIDVGLSDDGADARAIVAAERKGAGRRFDDLLPGGLGHPG